MTPKLALILALPLLLAATSSTQPAGPFAPTSTYLKQDLDGWTVYVSQDLREKSPALRDQCLALLRLKLADMVRALPPAAVKSLRPVPIWLELDDPPFAGGAYHPSADWLRKQGHNPDKAGAVEFGNARNFIDWAKDQPCMVLHEFAHAYHFRVLGESNPAIQSAFENAKSHHLYDNVLRSNGHTEKSYALTNDKEYFAESSEAFFGANDFYPFVRAELEQYDPTMADTLRSLWGVKR